MSDVKVNVGGPGCITTIIGLTIMWALLFGVNYEGKHYGVSCTRAGVDIDTGSTR